MGMNRRLISSVFAVLAVVLMLKPGAFGQACSTPNWATGPTIWAAEDSIKVVQGNDPTTNQPIIPVYAGAGEFNPQGYALHPAPLTQLNPVWSCPAGTPTISVAGAGRETVAFQLMISAGTSVALSNVSVNVSPLAGPGTAITSDNTQTSAITRYLEGYIPESYSGGVALPVSGNFPDPLIPFYDPYDAGNGPVATPFNVGAATTQGVWVDIAIPASQAAGTYTGTVTVTGNGVGTATYPINLTVWNGNLPRFNDPNNPDMLKAWIPLYGGELQQAEGLNCLYDPGLKATVGTCPDWTLVHEYLTMAHNYDFDTQVDGIGPSLTPAAVGTTGDGSPGNPPYPTAITSIDWTNYDLMNGPALTPNGLFADGSTMRVIDAPFSGGGGPFNDGFYEHGPLAWNNYGEYDINTPPPPGLLQLFTSYSTLISQHFTSNQQSASWTKNSEIIAYTFDETYDKLGGMSNLNTYIEQYAQALNQANATNSWVNPLRFFLTAPPGCIPGATEGVETGAICTAQEGLSYPAVGGVPNDWIEDWSPDGGFYEPGPSTDNPDYTMDGVAANSTAPVPIEKWMYGGGDPYTPNVSINSDALGLRTFFWIAAKYGLDQTSPSPGDPSPVATPGGAFNFAANYWAVGDGGSPSSVSDCSTSPFYNGPGGQGWDGNGYYFYPGNEVGCYYQANSQGSPVGATILTTNPVANTNCSTADYSTCNGISGPVTSMTMEEWRRGYEDYMYLYLLRKQNPAQATQVIDSMGGGGLQNWNALNWQNADPNYLISGVFSPNGGFGNGYNCTAPSLNLPYGPTGAYGCPGEWSHNPNHYEQARITIAQDLGFVSNTTLPTVTGISPASGSAAGGTSVTITGTGFTNATVVSFGGAVASSFTANSDTQITAVSPAGAGTVDVTVGTTSGNSVTSAADQFAYPAAVLPLPTVTGVSPASGTVGGGTSVTITGTNFTGATAVNFGGTAATGVTVNSATQATAVSPAGTGTVDVTIVTPGGTSAVNASDQFAFVQGTYTLTASPTAVSVKAGQSGTATLTLTPTGGYAGSVTLSCANLPANATCAFSQGSGGSGGTVMMSGNNQPVQVTMTIQTDVAQVAAMTREQKSPLNPILPALAFWWPGSIVGLGAFRRRKKAGWMRSQQRLLQIGLLMLMSFGMAGLMTGCGGGSNSSTTPAGVSTVTVTSAAPAGSTGLSQSATFTLTVTR
jgi:hypothetical protein